MQTNEYTLNNKIKQLKEWVENYDFHIAILKKLKIRLNKDGTYPQRPFCNLFLEGCEKDEEQSKFYGFTHYKLKLKSKVYIVCITKYDDDVYIWHAHDKGLYIGLGYLRSASVFERHIEERIAHCEKQKAKDEQKLKDYPKVFKQLQKINALSLETWEVQELL